MAAADFAFAPQATRSARRRRLRRALRQGAGLRPCRRESGYAKVSAFLATRETGLMTARWLTLIGIGEDGRDGLSPAAARRLAQARFIIGGARHLALMGPTEAETLAWPSPFEKGIEQILARRGQDTCVLASGDPFLYGVGSTLSAHVAADEMIVLPAPSSLSLAAARLGWALQDCDIVSLHGRSFERIIPCL